MRTCLQCPLSTLRAVLDVFTCTFISVSAFGQSVTCIYVHGHTRANYTDPYMDSLAAEANARGGPMENDLVRTVTVADAVHPLDLIDVEDVVAWYVIMHVWVHASMMVCPCQM
jgi:hypothetical protein